MPRKPQPTAGDTLRGILRNIRENGLSAGTKFFQNQRYAKQVMNERLVSQRYQDFGDGETAGNRTWNPPVHATRSDGRPITISYGTGPREGEYLVADGHVDMSSFMKKHDHFDKNGNIVKDRSSST